MLKILAIIGGVVGGLVILGLIVFNFFPQVWLYGYARWAYSKTKTPNLYNLPKEKSLTGAPIFGGQVYKFKDINFSVPWSKRLLPKESGLSYILKLDDKHLVVILGYARETYITTTLLASGKAEKVKRIFGEEIFQSEYSFYKKTLNITPDQFLITSSPREAVALSVLIPLKKLFLFGSSDHIYSFETENVRGFQVQDATSDQGIVVEVFDQKNNHFTFVFKGLSQQEVDSIIASIRN